MLQKKFTIFLCIKYKMVSVLAGARAPTEHLTSLRMRDCERLGLWGSEERTTARDNQENTMSSENFSFLRVFFGSNRSSRSKERTHCQGQQGEQNVIIKIFFSPCNFWLHQELRDSLCLCVCSVPNGLAVYGWILCNCILIKGTCSSSVSLN